MRRPSFSIENKLREKGYSIIAGIDEVGRGPLAGPVVAAAVVLPEGTRIQGLADSKLLSAQAREKLFVKIRQKASAIGIGIVSHKLIDKLNIGKANLLAMKIAVENLGLYPDYLLIDGKRNKLEIPLPQTGINSGDKKCSSIAAASIIAKVTRDRLMLTLHKKYPEYRFDRHKGYGTREHFLMLKKFGPCPIHRRSFTLKSV
ncbi:MAG: ribonuclease HII [Candidatus Margulisiibacteriota bacterium]